MADVIRFGGSTVLPIPVDRVLTSDEAMACEEVLVLGWRKDGSFYFAGSEADLRRALMLVTLGQRWITDQYDTQQT